MRSRTVGDVLYCCTPSASTHIHTHTQREKQNSQTSPPYSSSLLKKSKILCNICPEKHSFWDTCYHQTGLTHLSSVICHDKKHSARSTQDTQHTAELCCDRIITEYTYNEYCNTFLTFGAIKLVLLHKNTQIRAIQTLMCINDWSRVSVRQEEQHLQSMWMQVAHGPYRHQPMKMPYWSSGTRVIELTQYCTRNGTTPNEGYRNASWW
jgi:hypothetical protein